MILTAALVQSRAPESILGLMTAATLPTKVILAVLTVFSLASWWLIFHKWRQFRWVRRQGDRFLEKMEHARGLEDAYKAVLTLPESPYGRVFRQGVNFFTELRPGALRERGAPVEGLTLTQLEALRMALETEEAEERDDLAQGLTWLAVIGSVSPLLGLLGTVVGIMDTFFAIARSAAANLSVVAPGVGEALITTVWGLAVAIPAVIAYNHFVGRLNLVSGELEGFSSEFIGTLAREGHL